MLQCRSNQAENWRCAGNAKLGQSGFELCQRKLNQEVEVFAMTVEPLCDAMLAAACAQLSLVLCQILLAVLRTCIFADLCGCRVTYCAESLSNVQALRYMPVLNTCWHQDRTTKLEVRGCVCTS